MSLTDDLRKDMFIFAKEGNTNASDILKMALASIKNVQLTQDNELTEQDIEKILRKEVKKIEDSISQFKGVLIWFYMRLRMHGEVRSLYPRFLLTEYWIWQKQ